MGVCAERRICDRYVHTIVSQVQNVGGRMMISGEGGENGKVGGVVMQERGDIGKGKG